MRRDTQIGIILGIVILVIIGVFLSTRSIDNETVLPDLVLSEGVRQKTEDKEIDINGFFKESKKAEPKKSVAVEYPTVETLVSKELIKSTQPEKQPEITHVETANEGTSLEGKWEGVAEEIAEEPEIAEQEETVEDVQVTQNIPSTVETVAPEKKSQISSHAAATEAVYYKVQANDNLSKIAKKHYGDGQKWIKIFDANRDIMPDSNSLYVGQTLLIPDITVGKKTNEVVLIPVRGKLKKERSNYVNTHTVKAGDTLYRIAKKYYNDPGVWIKILEANEDTIEDEGSLKEGQVLILPKL
ncbi:MAG: LysM peptidoglycan-binding domain-containing protein [Candidatus Scalindua sp.]|nr:LysM peptidoglycan-binding domain-containing protein [Candidatus Scalindua sp.]MCR4344343.1 LysM peptidoglycan-binding domain-containing protein [Candidatus Scalindua sp.]